MAGTGSAARIVLYAVCSTFALATMVLTLYYLRNRKRSRKKERITGPSIRPYDEPSLGTFIDESGTALAEVLKENGHGEFSKGAISSLLRCIELAEPSTLEKFLVALLNCSAFTANQVKGPYAFINVNPGSNYRIQGYSGPAYANWLESFVERGR